MRVLVVDDDSLHLLLLRRVFEKSDHEVIVARNGREALLFLEFDASFHLIITDIMMPVMDGIEFLAHVKNATEAKKIPVIGFTAGDVAHYQRHSGELFECLLPKPFDFFELYQLAKEKALS
jgi:CheY-like chemotaxis protein